jgi:hypothetical protein
MSPLRGAAASSKTRAANRASTRFDVYTRPLRAPATRIAGAVMGAPFLRNALPHGMLKLQMEGVMRKSRFVLWVSVAFIAVTVAGTIALTWMSHDDRNSEVIQKTLPAPSEPAR